MGYGAKFALMTSWMMFCKRRSMALAKAGAPSVICDLWKHLCNIHTELLDSCHPDRFFTMTQLYKYNMTNRIRKLAYMLLEQHSDWYAYIRDVDKKDWA